MKRLHSYDRRYWYSIRKNMGLYFLMLIPISYVIIFKYMPMYGAQIAFKNYSIIRGVRGSAWVGFKHFRDFFGNYIFWRVLLNLLSISFYSIVVFPVPIILALLINYNPILKFRKMVQLVTYAPHFISTVVLAGMILQFLALRNGVLNMLLGVLGVNPIDFLGNPILFSSVYVWSGVWQNTGYAAIIYIAALSSVNPELHEAAVIDGASIVQRIRHIDLPSIMPTIVILLILRCGRVMTIGYEKILLLQNNLNLSKSEVISTYVYKVGIVYAIPRYSYASAVGLFVSVVNLILLVAVNQLAKKASGNALW